MRSRNTRLTLLAACLLAAGCAAPPTPAPPRQAAYVGLTPAFEAWGLEQVNAYWEAFPDNGVLPFTQTLEHGLEQARAGEIRFLIAASPPPEGWFATPLFRDAVAVVVNEEVGIAGLALDDLYAIFLGLESDWSVFDGPELEIQPVIPLEGDEVRTAFEQAVMGAARFSSNAVLAPNPAAALELVSQHPGSIALLPWSAVGESRVLRLGGVLPSAAALATGRYPLVIEVNALAPKEPVGAARQFLGWLQASAQDSN